MAHCFGPRGLYKRKFCAVCRKSLEAPALRCEGTADPGPWPLLPRMAQPGGLRGGVEVGVFWVLELPRPVSRVWLLAAC